jgi:hypothetical protein
LIGIVEISKRSGGLKIGEFTANKAAVDSPEEVIPPENDYGSRCYE